MCAPLFGFELTQLNFRNMGVVGGGLAHRYFNAVFVCSLQLLLYLMISPVECALPSLWGRWAFPVVPIGKWPTVQKVVEISEDKETLRKQYDI